MLLKIQQNQVKKFDKISVILHIFGAFIGNKTLEVKLSGKQFLKILSVFKKEKPAFTHYFARRKNAYPMKQKKRRADSNSEVRFIIVYV